MTIKDAIERVRKRVVLEKEAEKARTEWIEDRRQTYRYSFQRRRETNRLLESKAGVVKVKENSHRLSGAEIEVVSRLKRREQRQFKGSTLPTECAGLLCNPSTKVYQRLFPSPTPLMWRDSPVLFPLPETVRHSKRDSKVPYSLTPVPRLTPEPQLQTKLSVNLGSNSPKSRLFLTSVLPHS